MAIKTVLGAQRDGAFGTLTDLANTGATRDELYRAVRTEYPAMHWTRADQLVRKWEAQQVKTVASTATYGTKNEPGLFTPHRYILGVTYNEEEDGDRKTVVIKIDSERALTPDELDAMALERAEALALDESPSAAGVLDTPINEFEIHTIIHLQK